MESTFEVIKRTGTWWADPWWEGEQYQSKIPLHEIRNHITSLSRVFDEPWVRKAIEAGPPNAILARLVGARGLWPFEDLMSLGRTIKVVSGARGFDRKVDSFIGKKSHATLFECQIAELFGQNHWHVSFLPECDRPTPDILIERDHRLAAVECKRLEEEAWEKWARELGMNILSVPVIRELDNRTTSIEFDQRLTELLTKDDEASKGLLAEIVERVKSLFVALRTDPLPAKRSIPGVVSVSVDHGPSGHQGSAGGIAISPHAKTRRIMHKVTEALPQIGSSETGIVAVFSDYVPNPDLLDVAMAAQLRANPAKFEGLAHVLVVTYSTIFEITPPVLWSHPNPKAPEMARATADSLKSALPFRARA